MDSVQESSRCKQTKPSLWPTRPAGRIRDHQARSRVRGCSARGLHGMPHVLSGLAPRPRKPEGRTRNRGAGDRPEGITPTGGSAPNEAHTHQTGTMERTHRERPLTAVSSTQSAVSRLAVSIGSRQYAVSEGGDTAHAHARNDTPPRPPHPGEERSNLGTRRTHPTGKPRPGQGSRTGSGSGILDAGRPGPPHRQHPSRHRHRRFHCRCRCRFRCRCDRASTPAPAPVGHPDPRHTCLRRCQPEPRPTWRPTRRQTPAKPAPFRRCLLAPQLQQRPDPATHPGPALAAPSLTG